MSNGIAPATYHAVSTANKECHCRKQCCCDRRVAGDVFEQNTVILSCKICDLRSHGQASLGLGVVARVVPWVVPRVVKPQRLG